MSSVKSEAPAWYAVYTKPRQESLAEAQLQQQGYEVFLPHMLCRRRHRERWLQRREPMFPRYLFVAPAHDEQTLAPVRSTRGVSGLVRFGSRIQPLTHGVIDALRRLCEAHGSEAEAPPTLFSPGQRVRILEGPFRDLDAIVHAQNGAERVAILLNWMGREARLDVSIHALAPDTAQ